MLSMALFEILHKHDMDNDSDMLLGDFEKAKSIGNVADGEGHFLRNRNQATFEDAEEEEFTENLSSDTTAETPNKNIQIREPVLEFGAVDKPFKEFGPALEFEEIQTKMIQGEDESGDEDEDWKHPGEIVNALAAFNREVDQSEAYDSVVQSQAESTLLSPSANSRELVEFGWKDRPR